MLAETAAAAVMADAASNGATFVPVKLDNKYHVTADGTGGRILIPAMNRHIGPETITQILEDARSSTSTRNWPWNYYFASDGQQHAIRNTLIAAINSFMVAQRNKYKDFNREWRAPHHANVDVGDPVYQSLEKLEPDKQRLLKSYYRCMHLLHAPIFLFFTVDQCSIERSWLEYGGFLSRTMSRAVDFGLVAETAGFTPFHDLIRKILQWDKAETPICGMSMHCTSTTVINEAWPLNRTNPT